MSDAADSQTSQELRPRITVGPLFGIPVRIRWSWVLLIGAFVLIFDRLHDRDGFIAEPSTGVQGLVLAGLIGAVAVVVHEFAHALTAKRLGLSVERIELSFDRNETQLADPPRDDDARAALMALAGPVANLGLAAIALVLLTQQWPPLVGALTTFLVQVNLFLGLVNLLPVPTSDGMRVVRYLSRALTGSHAVGFGVGGIIDIAAGASVLWWWVVPRWGSTRLDAASPLMENRWVFIVVAAVALWVIAMGLVMVVLATRPEPGETGAAST